MPRYLSHYAPGASPDAALDRQQWEAQRRVRLSRPATIQVDVDNFQVRSEGPRRLDVTFVQRYRSDSYSDRVRSREFAARVDAWRRDWESRDVARYARHYSREFRSDDLPLAAWLRHKQRVNAAKSFIRVRLDDLSMFAYPGERDVVVVSFEQDYRSSNFSNRTRKRQYWQREPDGRWRIVYEGSVKLRPEHLRGIPYSARVHLSER